MPDARLQSRREKKKRLLKLAGEAAERLDARVDASRERMAEQGENIREAERRCRARSHHERTMDARDRVARKVADDTGASFTDAQRFVGNAMRESRKRKG